MPDGMKSNVWDFVVEDLRKLDQLRNELHTWAFENIGLVEKTYRRVYANKTDREAEIAAHLHTMAQICGDPELSAKLRAFRSVVPIQCFILLMRSLISQLVRRRRATLGRLVQADAWSGPIKSTTHWTLCGRTRMRPCMSARKTATDSSTLPSEFNTSGRARISTVEQSDNAGNFCEHIAVAFCSSIAAMAPAVIE